MPAKSDIKTFKKSRGQRWRESLAWDGLLPMGLTAIAYALRIAYPNDEATEISTFIVLPLAGAGLRASIGTHQLRHFTDSAVWWRQALLALAIVILWGMEAMTTILSFADDAPLEAWLIPAAFYACYLPVIMIAFWQPADVATSNSPSSS